MKTSGNTGDQPGCIKADSLSGSYFQMYFHDKHLFQMHHVWYLEKKKKIKLVTTCIEANKVSWQRTLIIVWIMSRGSHFGKEVGSWSRRVICHHTAARRLGL